MFNKKIIIITLVFILIFNLQAAAAANLQRLNAIKEEVQQAEKDYDRNKIINLKEEAAELVNDLETAAKFKEIFLELPPHDNQAEAVVERLSESLAEAELYELMKLFPENYSISSVHRSILDKSDSLEDLEKLLNQVPENNYVFHPARSKAVRYVDDLESAAYFKEIFPDLDSYNKEAAQIYRKLKDRLNREEIIKLAEIFKEQKFNNIDHLILQKSENMEDVLDTLERYPEFKTYIPSQVKKLAYKFVKDSESAQKFLAEFPDDNQYKAGAEKYLSQASAADSKDRQKENIERENETDKLREAENTEPEKKLKLDKNKSAGYNKLIELEAAINSGLKSEMSAKKEAFKYVDSLNAAEKFKDIFYNSIGNSDIADLTDGLLADLNKNEIKELITLFSEYPASRNLIYKYIDQSENLDQVIAASKEFKDHKYQSKASSRALEFVNDLASAKKYKNNFLEEAKRSNSADNYQLYQIVKYNLDNVNSMEEAVQISRDFEDVFSIISLRDRAAAHIDSKNSLAKFADYYPLRNLNIDSILNQLPKEELLKTAEDFDNPDIQNAARRKYFNQSSSYQDYRIIIEYFPKYKNEAVSLVLNSINNIEQAVKAKNIIPELENEIEAYSFDYVDNLYAAVLYKDEFEIGNKKSKIVKKLIKTAAEADLVKLLAEYNFSGDKEKIYSLSKEYQKIKKEYNVIADKNPEFNIQGEIEDRSQDVLYISGRAFPIEAASNVYGTLLNKANIYIVDYKENSINANFYVSGGHYLIKKRSGENYFGQKVPVWIYGAKPKRLVELEAELNNINSRIDDLKLSF